MKTEEAAGIQLIRLGLFSALLGGLARTWADPDLWGHLRFGGDIVAAGLPRVDPYSFTSDVPWINHEWLSEVLMHGTWIAAGGAGLIALKMGTVLATLFLIIVAIRHDRVSAIERDFLLFAAIVGMWSRVFVVRPQVFSIALYAGLLSILKAVERGRTRAVWLLPPLFALWTNLHGGWIVGLGTFGLWTAMALLPFGNAAESKARDPYRTRGARGVITIAAVLTIAATLVNPYGFQMWAFLRDTVGPRRPNINDWRPLLETGAGVVAPWVISAVLAATAFFRAGRRIPTSHALIVLGLGLATLRINRLDVFFMLSVVILLGPHIGSSAAATPAAAQPLWTRRMQLVVAAAVLAALAAGWQVRTQFTCLRLDGAWMPERESGAFIAQNKLEGRLLAWFDWGQYAIWHFAPRLRVSIDGRRETVYSDAFVAQHVQLYFEPESMAGLLHRLAPDYAWLPRELPLVQVLEREGWTRVYSGPVSVVLAKESLQRAPVARLAAKACFPGP